MHFLRFLPEHGLAVHHDSPNGHDKISGFKLETTRGKRPPDGSNRREERGMTTGQTHGRLWSAGARNWARFVESNMNPIYTTVHERLGIGPGTRLLDVGCGPGGAALLAAKRGGRVAGLDASPGSIEVARERLPDADFVIGDMESLPWPDASFDVVTFFNSLQFAGGPVNALRQAQRVLADGGRLGVVIWSRREESQQTRIMDLVAALAPPLPAGSPGPFALSATGALEAALEGAGLRVVDEDEMPEVTEFATAADGSQALMSGGGAARAIAHSGEDAVRQAILAALEEFRTPAGGYRIENRFRFVIAER
jgi:SAM-dependent methyltransferase